MFDTTDQLAVNTIRTLSLDAIQKANSGIIAQGWQQKSGRITSCVVTQSEWASIKVRVQRAVVNTIELIKKEIDLSTVQ